MQRLTSRERRALGSVGVQFFVNGAGTASFLGRLPELRDQIDVNVSVFGVLLTTISLFGLVASGLVGRIVHRFGTRKVLSVGAFGMLATLPIIGSAAAPWVFVLAVGAYMFGDVIVDVSMNLQGSWLSARRRVPVMNRLHGLWSLGTVAGGAAAAQAAAAGVPLVVHLSIAAAVVATLLVFVVRGLLATDEEEHADAAQHSGTAVVRSPRVIYALLALGGAFAVITEQVGLDWSTFRISDDFGASAGTASLAYVAFAVGMALARFGGDQVQGLIGHARMHQVAVTSATVGMTLAAFAPMVWGAMTGFVLAGAGVATFLPRLYDEAARAAGRRGAGLGVMTGGMRLGALFEPVLIGGIAGTSLTVGNAIAIVALPSVIGYAIVTHYATGGRP